MKLSREETVELAKSYAEKGLMCSEAVLLTICDFLGIENKSIPAIATGFGAGIGGYSSVCGALSGGIMGLGIRFGRSMPLPEETQSPRRVYWFAQELISKFSETHNSYICKELTGCDFNEPGGREKFDKEKHWERTCREIIGSVAGLVYDIFIEEEVLSTGSA